jgi:hypothetical protein
MTITNPLQHLINLLEEVKQQSYTIRYYVDEVSGLDILDLEHYTIDDANYIGSQLLFDEKGRLRFDVKESLHRDYGYRTVMVRSVKTDLYSGWTIAGIEIKGVGVVPCHNHVLLQEIEYYTKRNGRN